MLVPEASFQEKLLLERRRALRSNQPLVVMTLDAGGVGNPGWAGRITDSLAQVVSGCVRQSDVCGLLKEDRMIGVILTEVEAEKVGSAQLIVTRKTRERLGSQLSCGLADGVAISFHIFPSGGGLGRFDLKTISSCEEQPELTRISSAIFSE
jgi:hypothetical protein